MTLAIPWIHGVPSVEIVAAHEAAHPSDTRIGREGHRGAVWLVIDRYERLPGTILLRVAQPGEAIEADVRVTLAEPTIVLNNGLSFWQSLPACKWAAGSRYLPCTSEGIPLYLLEQIKIVEARTAVPVGSPNVVGDIGL